MEKNYAPQKKYFLTIRQFLLLVFFVCIGNYNSFGQCSSCDITNPTIVANSPYVFEAGKVTCFTSGTTDISGDITFGNGGTLCIAAGATLNISSNNFSAASTDSFIINVEGTLNINTGNATLNSNIDFHIAAGGIVAAKTLTLGGKTMNIVNNGTFEPETLQFSNPAATIIFENNAVMNVTNTLNINNGISRFLNKGTLVISQNYNANSTSTFINCGTYTGKFNLNSGGTVINSGTFNSEQIDYGGVTSSFNNYGEVFLTGNLNMGGAGSVLYNQGNFSISNTGQIQAGGNLVGPSDNSLRGYFQWSNKATMNNVTIGPNLNFTHTTQGAATVLSDLFNNPGAVNQLSGITFGAPLPAFVLGTVGCPNSDGTLTISGTVFHDANSGNVDGIGEGMPDGTQLYVNVIDNTGKVVAVATVASNGGYSVTLSSIKNYTLQLGINNGTIGNLPPVIGLPVNWANSNEGLGPNAVGDGVANGELIVPALTKGSADFGILKPCTDGAGAGGVPTASDSDGDGINDICDLDDDNDGILDSDENASCGTSGSIVNTLFWETFGQQTAGATSVDLVTLGTGASTNYNYYTAIEGTTPSGYGAGSTSPGFSLQDGYYTVFDNPQEAASWANGAWHHLGDHTDGVTSSGGRMLMVNAGDTTIGGVEAEFYRRTLAGVVINAPINVSLWVMNMDVNTGRNLPNITIRFEQNGSTVYEFDTNSIAITTPDGNFAAWNKFTNPTLFIPTSSEPIDFILINNGVGGDGNDLAIDDILVSQSFCDADGDGIPNYLDTDSDNDGCPDATEGANHLATIATLSGGSIGGSSANLGTASNLNGIPLPLGKAGGSETTGQVTEAAVTDSSDKTSCMVDLELSKKVTSDAAGTTSITTTSVGATIYYHIKIENKGPLAATGIQVKDVLPTGLSYNSSLSVLPANTEYDATTGIWTSNPTTNNGFSLAKNSSVTLVVAATVQPNCGAILNSAEIIKCNQEDIDSVPNNKK